MLVTIKKANCNYGVALSARQRDESSRATANLHC